MFSVIIENSDNSNVRTIVCETPCLDEAYQAFKDACKNRREGGTVVLSATLASDGPDPSDS